MGEILVDGGLNIWSGSLTLEYWDKSEAGSSQVVRTTDCMEGDYCARLDIDGSDSGAYIYQTITLVNSRKYRLTIWYKTAASKTAKFWLNDSSSTVFLQSDGTWAGSGEITLPTSTEWRRYELYFTAHASYQSYVLYLGRGTAASTSIYFDSLSIRSFNGCGILYDNEWDIGTLTASTEETYFPSTNTRHRWHKKTWRSTSIAAAQWLKVDRGVSTPGIKAFIVRNNNYTSAATIKIMCNALDVWTSPTYTQTLNHNAHTIAHVLRSTQNLQWIKHEITDVSNPNGYIEAGRIFLGPIFEPERNYTLGGGEKQKADPSSLAQSEGGQISSVELEHFRLYEYTFERIENEDFVQFAALFAAVGQGKGFFFVEDLGDPTGTTAYVRFAQPLSISPQYGGRYTLNLSLEELR